MGVRTPRHGIRRDKTVFLQELKDLLRCQAVANFVPVSSVMRTKPVQILSRFEMILEKHRHKLQKGNPILLRKLFKNSVRSAVIEGKPVCCVQLLLHVWMDLCSVRERHQNEPGAVLFYSVSKFQQYAFRNVESLSPMCTRIREVYVQG